MAGVSRSLWIGSFAKAALKVPVLKTRMAESLAKVAEFTLIPHLTIHVGSAPGLNRLGIRHGALRLSLAIEQR